MGFFPCSKDIVAMSLLHLQRLGDLMVLFSEC